MRQWGGLFFGFFLLAKQKKETRKSRESDNYKSYRRAKA
jgi:hypothetical protein